MQAIDDAIRQASEPRRRRELERELELADLRDELELLNRIQAARLELLRAHNNGKRRRIERKLAALEAMRP